MHFILVAVVILYYFIILSLYQYTLNERILVDHGNLKQIFGYVQWNVNMYLRINCLFDSTNMQLSVQISAVILIIELVIIFGQADDILVKRDIEKKMLSSLSPHCSRHLVKVISAYQNSSLAALTDATFGHGRSNEFITDSRFQYRMMLCFELAGEEYFSPSETPTTFCYRYNPKQYNSIVHTICFPKLCLEEQPKFWNIYEKMLKIHLPENDSSVLTCIDSRREKQWWRDSRPIFLMFIIVLLWTIVFSSTIYQIKYESETKTTLEQIFLAFSAKRNIHMIFKTPKNRSKIITCMFGIRVLTMIWIVIGHMFAFVAPYIENVDEYYHDIADNFANQWLGNFLLSVDVFLVLGGTVNAYGFFQKYKKLDKNEANMDVFKVLVEFLCASNYSLMASILLYSNHSIPLQ
ncbi:Nose resistant to fluoxetine protein [Dirofilaria immitis]